MANKKAKDSQVKPSSNATKPMAKEEASPPAQEAAAKPTTRPAAKPQVPPRPVPPHQQFAAKGMKPQHMAKSRMIRHQGR